MARRGIHPVALERPFAVHEIFFSTTDRKGVIRSGNRVFARVAGYEEHELIGEPHNVIRHPDMPRVVFQLLWNEIGAGRQIAAYVKNMASDGAYYWVLATVVPIADGYLSVRVKPTSPLLGTVEALYQELRALEESVERTGGTPKDAMAASAPRLLERLTELGFADYAAFMRVALPVEMRCFLDARGAVKPQPAGGRAPLDLALAACTDLRILLASEFSRLERYDELDAAFAGKSESVLALADEIRLFSLNAQIGAARLRDIGAALGVIADIMRVRSDAVAGSVRAMSEAIDGATSILETLAFEVALATLQCETAYQFMREVQAGESTADPAVLAANVRALAECLRTGLEPLGQRLGLLQDDLGQIGRGIDVLREELGRLEMLQVAGRVETARLTQAGEFSALFQEIRSQVETAKGELAGLNIVRQLLRGRATAATNEAISRDLGRVLDWVQTVSLLAAPSASTGAGRDAADEARHAA